jgi:hypothetical protein
MSRPWETDYAKSVRRMHDYPTPLSLAEYIPVVDSDSEAIGRAPLSDVVPTYFLGDSLDGNMAWGYQAMQNIDVSVPATVYYNIGIGAYALRDLTTGINNIVIGSESGLSLTTGFSNIVIGSAALPTATTAEDNVAIGSGALEFLETGINNVGIGSHALQDLTTGNQNTGVGKYVLANITTHSSNTAVGFQVLKNATAGTQNTAVGAASMDAVVTGGDNTAIGFNTLGVLTSGTNNVAIGSGAAVTLTTGTGNIVIGQAAVTTANSSVDQIVIGRGVTGVADNAITLGDVTRAITCNYDTDQTWDAPSDLRMKNVLRDSELGLEFIKKLIPIEYTFKPAAEWPREWNVPADGKVNTTQTILGMGAQDVRAALDAEGECAFQGWSVNESTGQQMLGESAFVYPLINAVKELAAQIEALKAQIEEMKA